MEYTQEVWDYIKAHSAEQIAYYERLQSLICELYPQLSVKRNYGIAMYYKGKNWVGLGFRKDGVSLYTQYFALINAFKAKHPKQKTGKACINFKLNDPLPIEDLKQVIIGALEALS